MVAGSRILKIMDTEEYAPQQNPGADQMITSGKIEFRNVSFSYDGEHNVLNNISFVANPGETVALVDTPEVEKLDHQCVDAVLRIL